MATKDEKDSDADSDMDDFIERDENEPAHKKFRPSSDFRESRGEAADEIGETLGDWGAIFDASQQSDLRAALDIDRPKVPEGKSVYELARERYDHDTILKNFMREEDQELIESLEDAKKLADDIAEKLELGMFLYE